MDLVKFGGDQTQRMTSKEIAELTGKEHSNVMRDIRNLVEELEKDKNLGGFNFELSFIINELPNGGSKQLPMYQLTKKETLLLVSGYSAVLRAKIINRWEELEAKKQNLLPATYIDALKALVASEEAKEQALLQVGNLNTVLDNLLDWVSIIKVAKFNKVRENTFNWRALKAKSEELGFAIKKAESPRFDYQNLYHLTVFKACYPQFNYNIK
jgi:Rha family phage regulatory protein